MTSLIKHLSSSHINITMGMYFFLMSLLCVKLKNRTIGPWLIWHHEIHWILWMANECMKSGRFHDEIWWISCGIQWISWIKSGGFHKIWQISWKMQISKCKIFKTFITLSLCKSDQQFLSYRQPQIGLMTGCNIEPLSLIIEAGEPY